MHKLDVAFCDTNETYGERFAAYLMEHKAKEFTVHLFPEPELFLQKIKNEKFDLVLLGSGFFRIWRTGSFVGNDRADPVRKYTGASVRR